MRSVLFYADQGNSVVFINGEMTSHLAGVRYRLLPLFKHFCNHPDWSVNLVTKEVRLLDAVDCSLVYAVKVETPQGVENLRGLKSKGLKIVLDVADNFYYAEEEKSSSYHEALKLADIVTVCSEPMKKIVESLTDVPVYIFEDVCEDFITPKDPHIDLTKSVRNVVCFGHKANISEAMNEFPRDVGNVNLILVTNLKKDEDLPRIIDFFAGTNIRVQYARWSFKTMQKALDIADIVYLPFSDRTIKKGASPNRVFNAIYSGNLVITSDVVQTQEFKDFCLTSKSPKQALRNVLEHQYIPEDLNKMVTEGQSYIAQNYKGNRKARLFAEIYDGLNC